MLQSRIIKYSLPFICRFWVAMSSSALDRQPRQRRAVEHTPGRGPQDVEDGSENSPDLFTAAAATDCASLLRTLSASSSASSASRFQSQWVEDRPTQFASQSPRQGLPRSPQLEAALNQPSSRDILRLEEDGTYLDDDLRLTIAHSPARDSDASAVAGSAAKEEST